MTAADDGGGLCGFGEGVGDGTVCLSVDHALGAAHLVDGVSVEHEFDVQRSAARVDVVARDVTEAEGV